jgi:hypothetical protein
MMLFAFLLFAQTIVGLPAYTTVTPDGLVLATDTGRYTLELGYGCDDFMVDQNVELLPGSGGVAAITPPGATDSLCNVLIAGRVSDQPCATDANGLCAISMEEPWINS